VEGVAICLLVARAIAGLACHRRNITRDNLRVGRYGLIDARRRYLTAGISTPLVLKKKLAPLRFCLLLAAVTPRFDVPAVLVYQQLVPSFLEVRHTNYTVQ